MKLEIKPGEGQLTQGTRVFLDGVEIKQVTKIVLRAEVDDVWRAEVHILPSEVVLPEGLEADVTVMTDAAKTYKVGGPEWEATKETA